MQKKQLRFNKGDSLNNDFFYVLSFDSTNHTIQTEKLIKEQFNIAIIPTPIEITHNCGLSIKIFSLDIEKIMDFVSDLKVPYGLYCLSNNKVNGKREICQIASQ